MGFASVASLLDPAMMAKIAENISGAASSLPQAGAAGGGILDKIGKMFQDPRTLQFLNAAGMDLMGNTPGKNLGASISQQGGANSMMGILSKALGGQMPGVTAKVTDKGITIDYARETPIGQPGPDPGVTGVPALAMPKQPTQSDSMLNSPVGGGTYRNPFDGGQPIKASDLAGLSAQDLMNVVQLKQKQEELAQQALAGDVDARYKLEGLLPYQKAMTSVVQQNANTDTMQAETGRMNAWTDAYTAATKDERTAAMKEYDFAQGQGYKGDFVAWQNIATPEMQKLFAASVEDKSWDVKKQGGLWNFIKERTRLGATTINMGPLERAEGLANLAGKLYFKDPKVDEDLSKYLNNPTTMDKIDSRIAAMGKLSGEDYVKAQNQETDKEVYNWYRSKIEGGDSGGKILSEKVEGTTIIWTVQWRDGSTTEVRHEF
jgi:hypothetical protein